MPNPNPLLFLLNTSITTYIFILILRVLLQYTGADSRNPVSGLIIKVTQDPLKALKPIFPTIRNFNLAAVALALALQMSLGLLIMLEQPNLQLWSLFIWSFTEIMGYVINVFIYSIFATVILSWIKPSTYNPIFALLYKITEPVLKPCQRMIPPMGGFDLSPMVALIALQVLGRFLPSAQLALM